MRRRDCTEPAVPQPAFIGAGWQRCNAGFAALHRTSWYIDAAHGDKKPNRTKLEGIETAIAQLSAEDLAKLRAWLEEFQGGLLDDMIDRYAKAGRRRKLAGLAAAALPSTRPVAVAGCDASRKPGAHDERMRLIND